MSDEDPVGHDSGVVLKVGLIDYDDLNEDGQPKGYATRYHFSTHELARTNMTDFIEMVGRQLAENVLRSYQGDDSA